MHCQNCGAGLPETAKFCASCGTKVEAQPAGVPPVGSGGAGDTAGTDWSGKMSWSISLPIFKNTVVLKQLGLAIGIPLALVAIILIVASGDGVYALYGLGLIAALLFFTWLFLMIVYRGKYEMDFILDDNGALYRTQTGQAKKNRIVNTLAIVLGVLSGKPAAVGAGTLAQSRQEELLLWNRITRVSYKPRSHTILLRSGPMNNIALFCSAENYSAVEDFVKIKTGHLES